jgi:hypothetical protein
MPAYKQNQLSSTQSIAMSCLYYSVLSLHRWNFIGIKKLKNILYIIIFTTGDMIVFAVKSCRIHNVPINDTEIVSTEIFCFISD